MIDTGGTLAKAADLMMEKSIERTSRFVHMPFYQETYEEKSQLELIVTDSIH
jgi:phosphoribosylpyrophosphate synthetase